MRRTVIALGALLLAALIPAQAQSTKFDGTWSVTLTCPPHNDDEGTKEYTTSFRRKSRMASYRAFTARKESPDGTSFTGRYRPTETQHSGLMGSSTVPSTRYIEARRESLTRTRSEPSSSRRPVAANA